MRKSIVNPRSGFTLIELMFGATILVIAIVALFEMFLREGTVSEHARNLAWAANDATRVMERLRQQNSGVACITPSLTPPAGFADWDAWLGSTAGTGGGGKSIQPNPLTNELIVLSNSGADPIQLTVAVCWRQQGRTIGECQWDGAQLTKQDFNGNGVITSPATLSTLLSCRR